MTTWIKGALIALFLASYPLVYHIGASNMDKAWIQKHTEVVAQYNSKIEGIKKENDAKEQAFTDKISLIEGQAKNDKEEFDRRINELERSYAGSLHDSSKRADIYRSKARASEAERDSLAAHAAELDRSLVEGKQVARSLRYTLEQRDSELRQLGLVLKSIEKKYE